MGDGGAHADVVDAWLARLPTSGGSRALLGLFEAAVGALWNRTRTTLGEVTLAAITDRVLHTVGARFAPFASLKVDLEHGVDFGELNEQAPVLREVELRSAIRSVLVDFLTVLGNLTADVLTNELHSELSRSARPRRRPRNETAPRPRRTKAKKKPRRRRSDDGKE